MTETAVALFREKITEHEDRFFRREGNPRDAILHLAKVGVGASLGLSSLMLLVAWLGKLLASFLEVPFDSAILIPLGSGVGLVAVILLLDIVEGNSGFKNELLELASAAGFALFVAATILWVLPAFLVDMLRWVWQFRGRFVPSRLLRAPAALVSILRSIIHSHELTAHLIQAASRLIPKSHRERYEAEWLGELDMLKRAEQPCLSFGLRLVVRAPRTALALVRLSRFYASVYAWVCVRLSSFQPLWSGMGTTSVVFITAIAGLYSQGRPPTRLELGLAVLVALPLGGFAAWHSRRKQLMRQRGQS